MRAPRTILVAIFFLAACVTSMSAANAGVLLAINFPQTTNSAYGDNATYWGAQKFTAGSNTTLTSIEVPIGQGILTAVSIRADNSNLPGTILSTWTTSSSSPASPPLTQTFTGSFNVTSGTSYWIVFHSNAIAYLYWASTTVQSGISGWAAPVGNSVAYTNDAGSTWAIDGYVKSLSVRLNGSTTTSLSTPNSPVVAVYSSSSVLVSETSTTSNASSYLLKWYASNGSTLIDSMSVLSSNITSTTLISGLTPNSNYYFSVTAIGDGITYSNSPESPKTSASTPKGSTNISLTAPASTNFRTITTLSVTTTKPGTLTFYSRNKRIAGCIKVNVPISTGSCSWRPEEKGQLGISVVFTPNDGNYLSSSVSRFIFVLPRTGTR
jgi:hypothetical protein